MPFIQRVQRFGQARALIDMGVPAPQIEFRQSWTVWRS
jgi:hypothetical protein